MFSRIFAFFVVFILTPIIIFSQTYNGPESAILDDAHNRYIVANAGNGMSGGSILAVDRTDLSLSYLISSGVDAPKGMVILGDTLYVNDLTVIRVIDLNTNTLVRSIAVAGASFLNDLACDNAYLYASDNIANKIFKIDIPSDAMVNAYSDPGLSAPNGLYYDGSNNRLLICSFRTNAPIQELDLGSGNFSVVLNTSVNNLDGISMDNNGNLYFSNWGNNKIYKVDPALSMIIDSIDQGFNGPADIFYCQQNDTLIVPSMNADKVDFIHLPSTSGFNFEEDDYGFQIYPNPAIYEITMSYEIDDLMSTRIEILDANGKKMHELINSVQMPSYYHYTFDVRSLHLYPGIYYVNLLLNNKKVSRKIIVAR